MQGRYSQCAGQRRHRINSTKPHQLSVELHANAARSQRVRVDNKCDEETGRIRNEYRAIDENPRLGRQRGRK